jgi:hypothetical protein
MLAWGMALLMAWPPGQRGFAWRIWAGRILLVLSIFVRPSALGLPLVLGIAELFLNRREREAYHSSWRLPIGATMVVLTLVALFPWAARNRAVVGAWIFTTTNSGFTAYDGFNPDADGASHQDFVGAMPQLRSMNEVQRSQYLSRLAKVYALQHPQRVAQLAGMKIARFWSPIPLSSEYHRMRYVLVGAGYAIPLDVLVVLGLLYGRLSGAAKVMLLLPAVYFTLAHALTIGSLRYRIPVEVPMAVIAASASVGRRLPVREHMPALDADAV